MELHPEIFDLGDLIKDVVTTSRPLAARNNNILRVKTSDELGTMYADLTKLRQILLNLLSNAAKFTQDGQIVLTVVREAVAEAEQEIGAEWIHFGVVDTGIGMTPEQMAYIFEPFSQVDESLTRRYGGTGLGLTISQRFCQMMGGEIIVESQVGVGSAFAFKLPAGAPGTSPSIVSEQELAEVV